MKRIVYHYVVMRTLEVPDECPSDNIGNMLEWIGQHRDDFMENHTTKEDTRDWEIVDVEENI